MATNSNRLQSVVKLVNKPPVQPFNKPQARQQPSSRTPQPSKVESLEDQLKHLNNKERLTFELDRFGYFTIEEGGRWTQAEIDTEWDRLYATKLVNAPTERSPAFVLNWNFKPESAVEQSSQVDEPNSRLRQR